MDVIYPIVRALRKHGVGVEEKDFLREYSKADSAYRKRLRETLCESLLDNVIIEALQPLGVESPNLQTTVTMIVNEALTNRQAFWYSEAPTVLNALRKKGYKLGLISNTHWRVLDPTRRELDRYFDVTTLSYEHGYVKPHPSIFLDTLKKLGVSADCCLHVGDDPIADIEGARKTGIRTAFIKRERKTANADICIRRLTDLVGLL
jgi:putative hydrolase of the HAD superfamily